MDKREVLEKLRRFSEIVVEKYNPLKIVLFGSYAKGTNKEESDIDVAVIVEKIDGSFLEKEAGLYKIRRNIDENIEPVLFEAGSDKSGFLESILSYGEVIYQR
ncbi:MAG TPA: nucleotidyltransferase domain-containing protein [bacterium]|jgi:predicted nucleotidyltransferase|nr:nucleotidyltransferase domain-containing protein [bacterium]MDX9804745.1 nucleotidyltransferase domain-containing protein [bacterium]HNZ54984.1 nucleotidyltransferase domain-containing protein [bacterium]HOB72251.1 nucleotidyltransferase domain-containing protein [bacterium]HOG43314.1 nucleotidyltransferase domain-containing protein [bacterium]